MTPVFADTSYFIALLSPTDEAFDLALEFSSLVDRFVTSEWVLLELADGLADTSSRKQFSVLRAGLLSNALVEVVPLEMVLHQRAVTLYEARPDKEWSLTDCVSFIIMAERTMTEALTTDHHFEQAGFVALLKDD